MQIKHWRDRIVLATDLLSGCESELDFIDRIYVCDNDIELENQLLTSREYNLTRSEFFKEFLVDSKRKINDLQSYLDNLIYAQFK